MMARYHQIYFLQRADGLVKIGTSRNLESRIAELTKSHGLLTVLRLVNGDRTRERHLHHKLRRFREYGEWFRPQGGELLEEIAKIDVGDPVEATSTKPGSWSAGEAQAVADAAQRLETLIGSRMGRTGLKMDAAINALCADYGLKKNFVEYVRKGRATTITAHGAKAIYEANMAEMQVMLEHLEAEIAALQNDVNDDEILALGDELMSIALELDSRIASRSAAAAEIQAQREKVK